MAYAIERSRLGDAQTVGKILAELREGATDETAAISAGVAYRTMCKWLTKDAGFRQLVLEARASYKQRLVQAVSDAGSKVRTAKESRSTLVRTKAGDMVEVQREEIEREILPDFRAAMAMLKARFPEEYGDIKRVDIRKIGGLEQVDANEEPQKPRDAATVINMMLSGDGSYISEADLDEPEDEPSNGGPPPELDEEVEDEPIW